MGEPQVKLIKFNTNIKEITYMLNEIDSLPKLDLSELKSISIEIDCILGYGTIYMVPKSLTESNQRIITTEVSINLKNNS